MGEGGFCGDCGAEVTATAAFCSACGATLGAASAAAPATEGKRRRAPLIAVGLVVVAALAFLLTRPWATPKPKHQLGGTITLYAGDSDSYANGSGATCSGAGGYSDMDFGAAVVVKVHGEPVATGVLGVGQPLGGFTCQFPIIVTGVPDAAFYTVEVSHRGDQIVSRADMTLQQWKLHLTLGDPNASTDTTGDGS